MLCLKININKIIIILKREPIVEFDCGGGKKQIERNFVQSNNKFNKILVPIEMEAKKIK